MASRRALDRIFKEHKIRMQEVMAFNNIETIKRSVEIGAGVAIAPLLSVRGVQSRRRWSSSYQRQKLFSAQLESSRVSTRD